MSGPSAFSYAQAAKGKATPQASTQSATPAQSDSHAKDDASSVTTTADAAANTFSTSSEVSESAKSSQIDMDIAGPKKASDIASGESGAQNGSVKDDASTTRSDETTKASAQPSTTEKPARQSNRSNEATDSKKGRKGRKGRNSEKEADGEQPAAEPEKEVIPVKLFEAPPPAVNIWEQRAAAAKTKPSSLASPTVAESSSKPSEAAAVAAAAAGKRNTNVEASEAQTTENTRPVKATEGPRPSTDQNIRRTPRGSRLADKNEPSTSSRSPVVEDASSWPTPETAAAEDGKRKGSEADQASKERQEDSAQAKAIRQKQSWKKVEITPTVVFNTPMPQPRTINKARGGGAQAGRNSIGRGHASAASVSERPQGAAEAVAESQDKPREEAPSRVNPTPFEKTKRFSTEQRDRKQPIPSINRGIGAGAGGPGEYSAPSKNESAKASKNEPSQGFTGQQVNSRGEGADTGRKESTFPNKDSKPRRGAHGNGRGGHNGSQSHGQPFISNGHGHNSRSNTYSPPYGPNGFPPNSMYGGPGSGRGGRGRPVSMSSGFKGPSNGAHKMHAQPLPADYNQYTLYNQVPFSPFPGYTSEWFILMHTTLKTQVEYYFSEDNLASDIYLKQNMDSQGFVPLSTIVKFKRVSQIAGGENMDYLRYACSDSEALELVVGDGQDLVRRRENWHKYPLPIEDRLEHARKDGPANLTYKSKDRLYLNTNFSHQQPPAQYQPYNPLSPPSSTYGTPYPHEFHPGYMNGPNFHSGSSVNGARANGQPAADDSSLNAAVPEFSPSHAASNGFHAGNQSSTWMNEALQSATTFTDEQLADLHVVARGQAEENDAGVPNGNADKAKSKINGDHGLTTPELVPTRNETTSPSYYRLDGTLAQVSGTNNKEKYADMHDRAIKSRQSAEAGKVPIDMKRLYKFWAHFLTANFNPGMYKEFRQLALDDLKAKVPNSIGHGNLLSFYQHVLPKSGNGGLWSADHPVYRVLQSDYDSAQSLTGAVTNGTNDEEQV